MRFSHIKKRPKSLFCDDNFAVVKVCVATKQFRLTARQKLVYAVSHHIARFQHRTKATCELCKFSEFEKKYCFC